MPMPLRSSLLIVTSLLLTLGVGCGDPCLDDGPSIGECKNPAAASGSETRGSASAGSETGDSASTNSETGTASASTTGDGDPSGDGDGDPSTSGDGDGDATGDGDGDATGDGDGDPCENGRQDPGETDVDCGGDCVEINPNNINDIDGQCDEGDDCDEITDCVAGECTEEGICNLCPDDPPEFDPEELGYNSCQTCLLSNCCDAVVSCLQNIEKCVCWFNCVENTGTTQQCMDECGNGNIGMINSCMNSSCGADDQSLNCDPP